MSMTPETVRALIDEHDAHWQGQRALLAKLARTYRCEPLPTSAEHVIQSSRGYEFVESYVSSLFSRAPACVLSPDLRGRGNPQRAEPLVNAWLAAQHAVLTDATRLAVAYPGAVVKLAPTASTDPYLRVQAQAIPIWDVVVDRRATSWSTMRWAMHRYWLPLDVAQAKWGTKGEWVGTSCESTSPDQAGKDPRSDSDTDPHVQVYEVYDLHGDRLYIWSPQYREGLSWAQDGIWIMEGGDGAEAEPKRKKYSRIPFRSPDDQPMLPMLPLFYQTMPGQPMEPIAPLARVADLVYEHAVVRTFQASAVRKASRTWLVRAGFLDDQGLTDLVAGVDGTYIAVGGDPSYPLSSVIVPVPHTPTPAETYQYIAAMDDDFQRGSITAPFTRGEATNATATEVVALAAYTSSEIGRMARVRDTLIEELALLYLAMVRVYVSEDGTDLIVVDGRPVVIRSSDLDADFRASALDQGSTPLGEAAKKSELVGLVPTLIQLGVPPASILEELVRRYDLPPDWSVPPLPTPSPVPVPTPGQAQRAVSGIEPTPEPILPGEVPPLEQIDRVLPGGE